MYHKYRDIRKFADGGSVVRDSALGERQIRVIASTPTPDRVGDILEPRGCDTAHYLKNPVVLANHDPAKVIGRFAPKIFSDRVEGIITFAPEGVSDIADEVCGLAKAGVLSAVSVGFRGVHKEPVDPKNVWGAIRYLKWELLEISIVAVPCNPEALVVSRALAKAGRVLSARNAASLRGLLHELDKCGSAHAEAVGLLTESDKHRANALRHASRIAASAQPDMDDGGDVDPDDDPDADVELSYAAQRRRMVEIYTRTHAATDSYLDADARKRAVEVAELAAL